MADEFHLGSGNWWDTPTTSSAATASFDTPPPPPLPPLTPSISTTLNAIASFGWASEMKPNSAVDSSSMLLRHSHSDAAPDPHLRILGFAQQAQAQEWNQASYFLGDKPETGDFRSSSSNFSQEHWSDSAHYRRIMNPGFSSSDFSSQSSSNQEGSQSLTPYGGGGVSLHEEPQAQNPNQNLSMMTMMNNYAAPECWNSYSPLIRARPSRTHLHFTNNTPFWNASASASPSSSSMPGPDAGDPAFIPDPDTQTRIPPPPSYAQKLKKKTPITKKTDTEPASTTKRPRPESSPPLKVRKEKVGDRISALQQLVSPFGKTDTASVLSEAIEYIKYLHDQIRVLTTPYLKNQTAVAPTHHHQNSLTIDRSKEEQGCHSDLRARGLCLVSVSSTFPLCHESSVEFWTPTFGTSFR